MSTTAFALAGLGGFNAHGAGFLAAASKCNVMPDLVTATSGQIIVLADWLQHKDLEKSLVIPELEHNPMAQLAVAFSGDPGVFRPAYPEMLERWLRPVSPNGNLLEKFFNRAFPAQLYVPTRPAADFSNIAKVFNDTDNMGIVFNAHNLKTGQAVLFGNPKAHEFWPPEKSNKAATRSVGELDDPEVELKLQPITAEAVQSALWLSLYGFSHLPQPHLIDGAYDRSCIVSELHKFDAFSSRVPWRRAGSTKAGRAIGSKFRTGRPRCGSPRAIRPRSTRSIRSTALCTRKSSRTRITRR